VVVCDYSPPSGGLCFWIDAVDESNFDQHARLFMKKMKEAK